MQKFPENSHRFSEELAEYQAKVNEKHAHFEKNFHILGKTSENFEQIFVSLSVDLFKFILPSSGKEIPANIFSKIFEKFFIAVTGVQQAFLRSSGWTRN